jgi:DNA mismatch repair ATPase MutS
MMLDMVSIGNSLMAMALTAREYSWCRPTMISENEIEIFEGSHPLQEACVEHQFVKNDTKLGAIHETGRLHIITGPNNSGKVLSSQYLA